MVMTILISSGAVVSVFPPYMPKVANIARTSYAQAVKSGKCVVTLWAANGSLIKTL